MSVFPAGTARRAGPGAGIRPFRLLRSSATVFGFLVLFPANNAAGEDLSQGIGIRVAHVSSSSLNIYDCQLRLDVRNHLDIPIFAMAGTLRIFGADGALLADPHAESTWIGPDRERRDSFAFKVSVEGGLNPANQLELVEQCDILVSAEYVLHACLDEHGDDIFERCASGLHEMPDSALPLTFSAVRKADPFTRSLPEAKTERTDEAQEIHLAEHGLTLSSITAELAARFEVTGDQTGLVIVSVDPDGRAAAAGLVTGDVVSEIDQREVTDAATARALFEDAFASDRAVLLLVERGGSPVFTVLSSR